MSFSDSEIAAIRKVFDQFDLDNSGAIDEEELERALEKLGEKATPQKINKCIAEVDHNSDGQIQFSEFLKIIEGVRKPEKSSSSLTDIFSSSSLFGGSQCAKCGKKVFFTEKVEANGNAYHKKCLTCEKCRKMLAPAEIVMFEGKMLCEKCEERANPEKREAKKQTRASLRLTVTGAKPCPRCGIVVFPQDAVIGPGGATWHKSCLTCRECSKPLETDRMEEKDDDAYCKACFRKKFGEPEDDDKPKVQVGGAKNCPRCTLVVTWKEAAPGPGGVDWHKHCLTCKTCTKKLEAELMDEKDGEAYCKACFRKNFGGGEADDDKPKVQVGGSKNCPRCNLVVTWKDAAPGPGGVDWHKHCLTCKTCSKKLEAELTDEKHGEAYCKACFRKNFGADAGDDDKPKVQVGGAKTCPRCTLVVTWKEAAPGPGGVDWHKACLTCRTCKKKLEAELTDEKDGEAYCKACFRKNFGEGDDDDKPKVQVGGSKSCPRCNLVVTWKDAAPGPGGVDWHKHCLTCKTCTKKLEAELTDEKDGEAYCKACFRKNFGAEAGDDDKPKVQVGGSKSCPRCNLVVVWKDAAPGPGGVDWHKHCLTCKTCKKRLEAELMDEKDGEAFCKACFRKNFGDDDDDDKPKVQVGGAKNCPRCNLVVVWKDAAPGPGGVDWHKACLTCKDCRKKLEAELMDEKDGEAYCKACFRKRFGDDDDDDKPKVQVGGSKLCPRCQLVLVWKDATPGPGGVDWHKNCLTCKTCSKKLDPDRMEEMDGEAYCKACFRKQFED